MSYYDSIPITQLPPATAVLITDIYPGVNTVDLTESPSGTTYKYSILQLQSYLQTQFGGDVIFSVLLATTGADLGGTYNNGLAGVGATITGPVGFFTLDSVTPAVGTRLLVKDQSAQAQNGIYVLTNSTASTPSVITRATDYDGSNPNSISQGGFVIVVEGATNELTTWIETAPGPFVVGTTAIVFAEQVVLSAVTDGANLGAGQGLFTSVISTVMEFKSLVAGTNVTLSSDADTVTINAAGSITGATNLGGDGLYTSASGANLQFKGLAAGSNVTLTPGADTITINSTNPGGTITGGTSLGGTNAVYAGVSGANLEFLGITAGTNVSIADDGTQLTISASGSGGGFTWNNVTGDTQAASVGEGYVCSDSAQTTVTLPATCAIGDLVSVQGAGAGGWVVAANTGQTIVCQNASATTTSGGTVTSDNQYDGIDLICIVANTKWAVHAFNSALLTFA